ncbi:uncharacterized protein LOC129597892 [Paramacrobiotus metropolitanus]|uniref:uncharacterized protein LOC129597892 n=1 Tax=Paramacrobiotus metropolitanus TaxID=2943436 RepID=UPI002445BC24|nr:uncharacterized protein LOC129597892 [Paramacrobiotus metropolitanus]
MGFVGCVCSFWNFALHCESFHLHALLPRSRGIMQAASRQMPTVALVAVVMLQLIMPALCWVWEGRYPVPVDTYRLHKDGAEKRKEMSSTSDGYGGYYRLARVLAHYAPPMAPPGDTQIRRTDQRFVHNGGLRRFPLQTTRRLMKFLG